MRMRIKVGICLALLALTASVVGASPSDTTLQDFEDQLTAVVEKASESVVSVRTTFELPGVGFSGTVGLGAAFGLGQGPMGGFSGPPPAAVPPTVVGGQPGTASTPTEAPPPAGTSGITSGVGTGTPGPTDVFGNWLGLSVAQAEDIADLLGLEPASEEGARFIHALLGALNQRPSPPLSGQAGVGAGGAAPSADSVKTEVGTAATTPIRIWADQLGVHGGKIEVGTVATGFIIDENGSVLTTTASSPAGAVGNATAVEVTLKDGQRWPMRVVGSDPRLGVALLRPAPGAAIARMPRPLPLGDSAAVRLGALAVVIANQAGLQGSVSLGVVAGVERDCPWDSSLKGLIQITAGVAGGSSGAPVLNSRGQVVGVVTAASKAAANVAGSLGQQAQLFMEAVQAAWRSGALPEEAQMDEETAASLAGLIGRQAMAALKAAGMLGDEGSADFGKQFTGPETGLLLVDHWLDALEILLGPAGAGQILDALEEAGESPVEATARLQDALDGVKTLKLRLRLRQAETAAPGPPPGWLEEAQQRASRFFGGGGVAAVGGSLAGAAPAVQPTGTFAIPINAVKEVLGEMAEGGMVRRASLGAVVGGVARSVAGAPQVRDGALVMSVEQGGAAERAGIQVGDVIIRFGDAWVEDGAHLSQLVAQKRPGAVVQVWLVRGTELLKPSVTLGGEKGAALPAPGKIAFASNRDGNWEIWVMDSHGGNQTNLTNNWADDESPCWSPDGSKIAFSSDRDGNREIYVMNSDGSNQVNLTNNPDWDEYPSWSPDGSKIAFTSDRDGNLETYVMNSDGTNQTNLTKNPAKDKSPSWSPDGSKIAFESWRDGNYEIYVMNSDGSNQTRLTSNLANDESPCWSPDGSKIAFDSEPEGNDEIYVMNSDGSNQTNLTNNARDEMDPSWSPDGRKIAFTSDRHPNYEIYVMNSDGSNETNLTNTSAWDSEPSWSPH